jgi:asparagine synthase (glutamine-hydrolysing)
MCGIAGIYAYHPAADFIDRAALIRMRDHMFSRGPDGKGEWYSADGRVGFGHRRLSIIDLSSRGAQPMQTADGRLVITFNGEIYNYRALRSKLEAKGYVFRSNSDTEVLLHLYTDLGVDMLRELRGMFAFAIWDSLEKQLLMARDPYGIKPLYYADDGSTLHFASQVKALMASRRVSKDHDTAGWVGFYMFGHVPEPFTTYREVRALPAGSFMCLTQGQLREPIQYDSIAKKYSQTGGKALSAPTEETTIRVRDALLDSVRHHLVADVPVGAFLSAGIDSHALVGLMRKAGQQDIQTITLAFDEFRGTQNDEAPDAMAVANFHGTRHTTRVVDENEFRADLPAIIEAMDQPTIDGINTWFVSKAARELGLKVAISGIGGDELFGGYPSFNDVPTCVRWMTALSSMPGLGRALRRAFCRVHADSWGVSPKLAGLVEFGGSYAGAYLLQRGLFMPWELSDLLDPEVAHEGLKRLDPINHIAHTLIPDPLLPFARVATLESSLYMRNQLLRDADWAGMAHSLEIRVPLVDAVLLEKLAGMGLGMSQQNLKHLLIDVCHGEEALSTVSRRKTGFLVPIAKWIDRQQQSLTSEWKRIPLLRSPRCHWSRRWAYSVACGV